MASTFDTQYKKLNDAQKKAVSTIYGPLLVLAGPGSGKTQLISLRVANILKSTDTEPSSILCLTFTESAAYNMRDRLHKIIGTDANKISIYTFHSFGSSIIQNYPEYFNDKPLLNSIDPLKEYEILNQILSKLPHNNSFAKKLGDKYHHLTTIRDTINWLKQSGISPGELNRELKSNDQFIIRINPLILKTFSLATSSKQLGNYEKLNIAIKNESKNNEIAKLMSTELSRAIDEIDMSKTHAKSITAWRNKWLSQFKLGHWQLKDTVANDHLENLGEIYEEYQYFLESNGLYTFPDMILRASQAIERFEELKLSLQEQYQFILVDEYQDTNSSQNYLLNLLSMSPVNEGRPNLMVVGDDDQAIFRFQGADSSIMLDFINKWDSTKIIALDSNYRSGQQIVDASQRVIKNSTTRVINKYLGDKLTVRSGIKSSSKIYNLSFLNESQQYEYISLEVNKLIDSGTKASAIAIISPKHSYLHKLIPYLTSKSISINYERRDQVLEQKIILQLLDLINLVIGFLNTNKDLINHLLPKILATEYMQLSANEWWEISAGVNSTGWLNYLRKIKREDLSNFISAISTIAKDSNYQSFELTIAQLIGNAEVHLPDNKKWVSPWREYYSSEEKIRNDIIGYTEYVSYLNTLIKSYKNWIGDKFSTISDFISYIDLYKKSGLILLSEDNSGINSDAVYLLTVHKAKGQEWDTVFLLNCQEEVWGLKTRGKNPSFTLVSSLKRIQPATDNKEDLIKLFYVGLSRAKNNLYCTSYKYKENNQASEPLIWLNDISDKKEIDSNNSNPIIHELNSFSWRTDLLEVTDDLFNLLKPRLETYKLSATHLNTFLALDRGGPQQFMLRHILKVPGMISPFTIYGDSIHKTLDYIQQSYSATKVLPKNNVIKSYYLKTLRNNPLTDSEYIYYFEKGIDELLGWLKNNKHTLSPNDISERDFSFEQVVIDDVKLTGKIDRLKFIDTHSLKVIDYKTGKPTQDNSSDALQIYKHERQLYFYKILVENSKSFKRKYKVSTGEIIFISPNKTNGHVSNTKILTDTETTRQIQLIKAVWYHIANLSFPDTSKYGKNLSGVIAFEEDLIAGKI